MLDSELGNRHQWLINMTDATRLLSEHANVRGFRLTDQLHIMTLSTNAAKRIVFRTATMLLPLRLRSDQFALLFGRISLPFRSRMIA